MRVSLVVAVAVTGLAPAASAQPLWTAEAAEIAYLVYGEPGRPVLSISCGQEEGETGRDETRIEVEVEPGTKSGKEKAVLRVEHDEGHKDVALTPLVCGGVSESTTSPTARSIATRPAFRASISRSTSPGRSGCRSMRPAPRSRRLPTPSRSRHSRWVA
jgi:hypothetical protein